MLRPDMSLALPWFRITGAVLIALALAATTAFAGSGGERERAERVLKQLADSPNHALARESIARASAALARGEKLRHDGDEAHARMAESAALAWAEMGRDLVHAIEIEARAASFRRDTVDAGREAEQQRALLEEEIAKNGKLRVQLKAIEGGENAQTARTSTAASASTPSKPGTSSGGTSKTPTKSPGVKPAASDGGAR